MPERTRMFNGKRYYYRNTLPVEVARRAAKELRARSSAPSIRVVDEGDGWASIWYSTRG